MGHGTRAIPRPSKPDDPDPVAEITAATRRALWLLAMAALAVVALVLAVVTDAAIPLAVVGVLFGAAVLSAAASIPWRSR